MLFSAALRTSVVATAMAVSLSGCKAGPTPTPGNSPGVIVGDALAGRLLFPTSNWWNQDISTAPVDPNSALFITFIGASRSLHADFGPPPFGIPYVGVAGTQPRVPVAFVEYPDESDTGFGSQTGYPIPEEAKTQSNFIEGGTAIVNRRSTAASRSHLYDRHTAARPEMFARIRAIDSACRNRSYRQAF